MEGMRKRIYISGPISLGDRIENLNQAMVAQRELMRRGFAPLNPMLSMLLPFAWDGEFQHGCWMAADIPWVAVADAVLRLPGRSVGADEEVQAAVRAGVPVFYSLAALESWAENFGV